MASFLVILIFGLDFLAFLGAFHPKFRQFSSKQLTKCALCGKIKLNYNPPEAVGCAGGL